MAHKKQGGKTSQHVSPQGKRLGLKVSHGQKIGPGMILVRQLGTKFKAGLGVKTGRDHSLYAVSQGTINFGQKFGKKLISIR